MQNFILFIHYGEISSYIQAYMRYTYDKSVSMVTVIKMFKKCLDIKSHKISAP